MATVGPIHFHPRWSYVLPALLANLVGLGGCASTGSGTSQAGPSVVAAIPPAELGRKATETEMARIQEFAPAIIEAARLEGFTCRSVRVAMADMPHDDLLTSARPGFAACPDFWVRINPKYLQQEPPEELGGALAHELSHLIDRDWSPGRAKVPQITREREADARSIGILKRISTERCLVMVNRFERIKAENIRNMGREQVETVGTHPSYTERIETFSRECRQPL